MSDLVGEWLTKAAEDYSVARGLLRRRKVPASSICFHSQQAAEKYLKAFLQENSVKFGKTHDLEVLLRMAANQQPALSLLGDDLKLLSDYAVKYRYPGFDATKRQARQAVQAVCRVRNAVMGLLKSSSRRRRKKT
ncbi:MAG: HEPN domain-containing protein [Planctomycetota bacterium]|jgi:HEPN domain-containing protein